MIAFVRARDSTAMSKSVSLIVRKISNLALDSGLSVQEVYQLIREDSVLLALERVTSDDQHQSKSRVAISTGLSRAEVAKIVEGNLSTRMRATRHPIRKLVIAWQSNRRSASTHAEPKILPIYGKGASFESLVNSSNRGIPVRAMLDQMVHIKAVKILKDQRVQLVTPLPAFAELTLVRELLKTSRFKAQRTKNAAINIRSGRKNLKRSPSAR